MALSGAAEYTMSIVVVFSIHFIVHSTNYIKTELVRDSKYGIRSAHWKQQPLKNTQILNGNK